MAKRWYIVQTSSGKEKAAMLHLQRRAEMDDEDWFGEILVPAEEIVEVKGGQKRRSERKLYPGYVLVQMEMNDASWHAVKGTPGVLGFVGGKPEQPQPLRQKEADDVLQQVREGADQPRPKTKFEAGELVRVIEGPFVDFTGTVEEVNYEKNSLQVAVRIFSRATPVDLAFGQVEKL
ncbi:MAG: transcription termination/antitermination protein NusG [Kistimonas sp.]|nr:transcription termination/antitermination protein NusG [Kistimonas sp.]